MVLSSIESSSLLLFISISSSSNSACARNLRPVPDVLSGIGQFLFLVLCARDAAPRQPLWEKYPGAAQSPGCRDLRNNATQTSPLPSFPNARLPGESVSVTLGPPVALPGSENDFPARRHRYHQGPQT